MAFPDILLHTVNLLLPAWALPALLVGLGRLARQRRPLIASLWGQWLCHLPLCSAVLLLGLGLTGQDGQMGTYGALVLASASLQWVLLRGWRAGEPRGPRGPLGTGARPARRR